MTTAHEVEGTRLTGDRRPFLTARWANLAMVNYAIDPEILQPILPVDCSPDLREDGMARCSLVAFEFRSARVFGLRWPGHVDFPEFNLRCYVRRGERRGVFFVRELVPRRAIAWAARWIYNEPYAVARMRCSTVVTDRAITVDHEFRANGAWQKLKVSADAPAEMPAVGDPADWYKEHCWGFGTSHRGRALTYEVRHPRWAIHPNARVDELRIDAERLYGPRWARLCDAPPESVLLAQGSAVSVSPFSEAKT